MQPLIFGPAFRGSSVIFCLKTNLKGSAVYLLNATSFITVNGTDNISHLPFLLDLSASTPANDDGTTLPAKCETGGTATLGKRSGYLPLVTI